MDDRTLTNDAAEDLRTALTNVPIEVTVAIGKARPMVKDLLKLDCDTILTLDKRLEDPVELYVGDRLIAYGILELQEDAADTAQLLVRLTEVLAPPVPLG